MMTDLITAAALLIMLGIAAAVLFGLSRLIGWVIDNYEARSKR